MTRRLANTLLRVLGLLAFLASLNLPGGYATAAEPIVVGMVVPITSVLAPYGTPFVDAVKLAFDEVNKAGGVNGRQLELVVEDSQASNTVAINALNRVLQSNPVAIFGPGLGTQILAMMPTIEREHIPTFAGPSTRRVTQQNAKYFFRTTSHDGVTKALVAQFIAKTLKSQRVGIMHVANEWGYSGRDNLSQFLEELGRPKPVSIASYQPTDKDLTAQILQMQHDNADVIFSQGHPVDEALIVRQLHQLNVEIPHIGSGSLCSAVLHKLLTVAEAAGQYCEGPDIVPIASDRPRVKAFVKDYTAKAGFPPDIYITSYYDVAHMLVEVMKRYGVDREKIRDGMREITYDGTVGPYHADEEGNLWDNAAIMQFQSDGSAKVIQRLKAITD